ncbi:MAG: CHASE2 domain-containing protein [Actinobacteria bacterium]|nr:CHASE2 domain-containing protein [Actinomycetota bacterium]
MPTRQLGRSVLIGGFVIGALSAVLYTAGVLEPLEKRIYDSRIRATAAGHLTDRIVIVGIDETDLQELGYPADPQKLGSFVVKVKELGATDVAFNDRIDGSPEAISELTETVSDTSAVFSFAFSPIEERDLLDGGVPPARDELPGDLTLASTAVGFTNRLAGPDGVLRRFTPFIGDRVEMGLAVAAAAADRNVRLPRQAQMIGEYQQLGPGPRLLIRYDRRPDRASYPRFRDVMAGEVDVRGKVVLLGLIAENRARLWKTPMGSMTDVEITAQIASALIQGRGITRAPIWIVVAALMAVSLALTLGATEQRPAVDFAFPPIVALAMWFLSGIAFEGGTWVDIVPIFLVLGLHLAVMPTVRKTARNAGDVPAASTRRFFEALLEVLLLGAFAHSGRVWTHTRSRLSTAAQTGDIPDHLLQAMTGGDPVEANRDEGQVVFIPIAGQTQHAGTAILLRRRGHLLSERRLRLLGAIARIFGSKASTLTRRHAQAVIIEALSEVAALLDEIDHFSREHPAHLASLAGRIGKAAGLSVKQLENLRIASHLHDLGKIGAPDTIIDSTVRLTDDEYDRVKQHPTLSRRILDAIGLDPEIGRIVGAHHERWDGKGYPEGKTAEEIPHAARVLAIADTLTSMLSDRPYRKGMALDVALEELRRQKSRMFDPVLVEITIELAGSDRGAFRSLAVAQSDNQNAEAL